MSTAEQIPAEQLTLDDFSLLADFVESNPQVWPTMQGARWAIHNAKRNGLDDYGVLVKRNGKIQVVKPRLVQWLLAGKIGR